MNITITDNGNLWLELEPGDDREVLREFMKYLGSEEVLMDLTEPYWTNGSYQPFNAGDGNPFVGLSSAPCIAESMDIDEDGKYTINGRLWAYTDYMLKDERQELLEHGCVEFELVE